MPWLQVMPEQHGFSTESQERPALTSQRVHAKLELHARPEQQSELTMQPPVSPWQLEHKPASHVPEQHSLFSVHALLLERQQAAPLQVNPPQQV
jgi:hypothetical protein